MPARHLALVVTTLALFCSACGVDLPLPSELRIVCADDASCPDGNHCSAAAGVCIPSDDPDESPRILSAVAVDSTTLTVGFSKPMRIETLQVPTNYALDFEASVVVADVATDASSVRLVTSEQRARTYTITLSQITDPLGRPVTPDSAQFQGIGRALDTAVPRTVAPLEAARVRGPDVNLLWTQNVDSISYRVEVARDTAMTDVVIDTTVDAATTATSVTLANAGQYFWRVTSDAIAEPSSMSSFTVLTDAVYVDCSAGAPCSAALDATRGGDPLHPLTTLAGGIGIARALGITTVRAVKSDAATFYGEDLSIASFSMTVAGGFNAAFTAVEGSSVIRSDNGACLIANPTGTVRLSDITCAGTDSDSGGVLRVIASEDVHLEHVVVRADVFGNHPLTMDQSSVSMVASTVIGAVDPDGPQTTFSVITGGTLTAQGCTFDNAPLDVTRNASLMLDGTTIVVPAFAESASATSNVLHYYGVKASAQAYVEAHNSRIMVGGAQTIGTSSALWLEGLSIADVRASVLYSAPTVGPHKCVGDESTCLAFSSGLVLYGAGSAFVQNSVIVGGGVAGAAIDFRDTGDVVVLYSSLIGLNGGEAVLTPFGAIDIIDSLLVCQPDASGPQPAITPQLPRTSWYNGFAGCAPAAHVDDSMIAGGIDYSPATMNLVGPRFGGNFDDFVAFETLFPNLAGADALLGTADDDVATAPGTAADTGGTPSESGSCGVAADPCATTTDDIFGHARSAPTTVGATELP